MWYVIQTRTGAETDLKIALEDVLKPDSYREIMIPMFEDVMRSEGRSRISFRRLFPGYLFVDTEDPEAVVSACKSKRTGEFARLLGIDREEDDRIIRHISEEDADFLKSILEDGIMHVSYVERDRKTNNIQRIVGPLAKYGNRISSLKFGRRMAVVDTFVFGKQRRIKFGLWSEDDPENPWIRNALKEKTTPEYVLKGYDIGIYPGDKVKDVTGLYGDTVFTVEKVNVLTRKISTRLMIFGETRRIELLADQVERVEEI